MLDVTRPFDQSVIQQVPLASQADAEHMLKAALTAFNNRSTWPKAHQRIDILKRLATAVEKEANEFALLIAHEGGKPLMDAKVEVTRAIDGIYLAIKHLGEGLAGQEIPMGLTAATDNRRAWTTQEPIGVVLALSAFNHPLNLIIHQVIPAVAVGCPVIVKPAATTPLCALKLCQLIQDAGLPKAWCQAIVCENDVAQYLANSSEIAFLTFIGSARVGWMLKSQLAPGVRCALEHGGVAPVIVDETANLSEVVPSLLKGGYYHAGQVCVSVQRVFAHESIVDALSTELAEGAKKLIVGDPTQPDTEVGPLISPQEVDRVHSWVEEAIHLGAKLLCGGHALSSSLYAPTVLLNPPPTAKISTSEVFGPVVCVYSYSDIQAAINEANALPFAFQAAVFSKDIDVAMNCAEQFNATAVMINDHTAFRADWMPFGGRSHSGYGMGGIGHTMQDMVQTKMVVLKSPSF